MKIVRFERSEDGGRTWHPIEYRVMRRRLAGTYRDVDLVVRAMLEDGPGGPVRTAFAIYRAVWPS
jgi:hypothetical protein